MNQTEPILDSLIIQLTIHSSLGVKIKSLKTNKNSPDKAIIWL